jgi:periplasmic copper chaperone A
MRHLTVGIAALALMTLAASVQAHDYKVGALNLDHPWARPTPPAAPVAGGYVAITNTGGAPDRLLHVESDLSTSAQVHDSSVVDGIARMRPLDGGLAIEPGQTVRLEPGGMHIMFMKPARRLVEGARFSAVLTFENAGAVTVEFTVQKPGNEPPPEAGHQGHGG